MRAEAAEQGTGEGALLVVTPALSLTGRAAEDAALDAATLAAAEDLAAGTADGGPALLVGLPWRDGDRRHDAVFLLASGRIAARRTRHEIRRGEPFDPGPAPGPVAVRGLRLGLMVGADWRGPAVAETLAETGAELLLALDAAPFVPGAAGRRVDLAVARVVENGLGFAWCNLVGGEGASPCDGGGFVLNPDRTLAAQFPWFAPGLEITAWSREAMGLCCLPRPLARPLDPPATRWRAMRLALSQAAEGRASVLVPLCGEPAGRLMARLAADALGPELVRAVVLASPAWPPQRLAAAEAEARHLGLAWDLRPLAPALEGMQAVLGPGARDGALARRLGRLALAALAEDAGALPLDPVIGAPAAPGHHAPLAGLDAETVAELARWRQQQGEVPE
jgi:NAD+ synthase